MNVSRALSTVVALAVSVVLYAQSAQAAIKTQYIEYMHGNTALKGYLAYDDAITGKRPGVLLAHYRGGLQGETLEDAQMIARMGYVVFAEDIFGKDIVPKTVPEMTALTTIYNNDRALMRTRARSGFDVLAKHAMVDATKIAVVGYCFGGTVAVELAETGSAGARHHRRPRLVPQLHAGRCQEHQGQGADPARRRGRSGAAGRGNKLVADLRAAKVNWELQIYSGSSHGFTNPSNAAEERADTQYKVAMERFFKELFGG